jgi:hypothetical protein
MKFASKIELSAGIGTVVLAFISSAFFVIATKSSEVLEGSLLYVGLSAFLAVGSYVHAIRGRISGLVILLLSGLILAAMGVLGSAVYYARGLWLGLPLILPCVTAAVAVIAAILAPRAR